jgi:hypothetical protein
LVLGTETGTCRAMSYQEQILACAPGVLGTEAGIPTA